MIRLSDVVKSALYIRPQLNIGMTLDIPNGRYHIGEHGESILCAGLPFITGITALPNMYKSTLGDSIMMTIMDRYACVDSAKYDSEDTSGVHRLHDIAAKMDYIGGVDLVEEGRLTYSDTEVYDGTEFYDTIKAFLGEKIKNRKNEMRTTPFLDREGKKISILRPTVVFVDSLSKMVPELVKKTQEKGSAGSADRNMENMNDGRAKSQLLNEMPTLTARTGCYYLLSAHMGKVINVDSNPHAAPPPKQLPFMKQDMKMKGVPPNFAALTNNCWNIRRSAVLFNGDSKQVLYPRSPDDDLKGDTDLMEISVNNERGKSGPSGMPLTIVLSQSEGVKVGLTEFHFLKENGRFGLVGDMQNYVLALCPEIKLSRSTVRRKIDAHPELRRALEICSEMRQMDLLWHDLPAGLMCTPQELYADLIKKGYDWKRLLNTRGYWTFEEDKHPLNFLSTMDLLNMRAGTYHPWWYGELTPATAA